MSAGDERQTGTVRAMPHPELRPYVDCYLGYDHVLDRPGVHHGLPAPALTVVIALEEPLDVGWLGDEGSRRNFWASASGLHMVPAVISYSRRQFGIQLDLTPAGARALAGLPAAALAAGVTDLADVLGSAAGRLHDEVAAAPSWPARFAALDRHLRALAGGRRDPLAQIRPEVTFAWDQLRRTGGRLPVTELAAAAGWSRRHLSEQFRAEYGLAPKQAARVIRFQRARSKLLRPPVRLADVAADCGYADQAHLTREFQELAGYSPTGWRRQELPFLQDRRPRR
jgi:AraC-like DNA-binding protein